MEKEFTASDICLIIKQCGDSGVSTFNLGRLRVNFGSPKTTPADINELQTFNFSEEQHEAVVQEVTERDELAHKESILAQMEIEDPVEFERLMTMGDLINSKDGEITDEGDSGP